MSSRSDDLDEVISCPKWLDSVVDDWARINPNAEACRSRFSGELRTYTYKDLQTESVHLASRIQAFVNNFGENHDSMRPIGICMNRDFAWYALYIAAIRAGVPVVPMTQDILDKVTESARNRDTISRLRPFLLVTDSDSPHLEGDVPIITYSELLMGPSASSSLPRRECPLAYVYTGGTTSASKCVAISHVMAMSEMGGYPEILRDRISLKSALVLQHTSTYWGATFLGQIDIALSLGGSVLFASSCDTTTIVQDAVSILGLVPSQLAGLDPTSLPTVRLVFTWGEKLERNIAQKWSSILLINLLVSTEYWLSMYSVNGSDEFALTSETKISVSSDGNLQISGRSVINGFYETSDRIDVLNNGNIKYLGRSDSMIKIGGEWFDLNELEEKIAKFQSVKNICIVPEFPIPVAYIEFDNSLFTGISEVKQLVNENYIKLEIVFKMIRNEITGKIDRNKMKFSEKNIEKKYRSFRIISLWIFIEIVFLLNVYLSSGIIGIMVIPFFGEYFLNEKIPRLFHLFPLVPILFPFLIVCLFPYWFLFFLYVMILLKQSLTMHITKYSSWCVSYYLGVPRQIELWLYEKKFDYIYPPKCMQERVREEKIWKPFGNHPEQNELIDTWGNEYTVISLSEEEVGNIGKGDWAKPRQTMEEIDSVGEAEGWIVSILCRVCEFLKKPITCKTDLTSVSSLSAVELSSLFRESGWEVSVIDILQSRTLGELQSKLVKTVELPLEAPKSEYRCQLCGWGFACTWLFEISRPRDRSFHLEALTKLMNKHSAFKVDLIDSRRKSYWMNEVLVVFGLLKYFSFTFFGSSVFNSFSRVRIRDYVRPYLGWYPTKLNSMKELRSHMLWKKKSFYPPFETEIIMVGNRQFLRLFLTHAFSDGSSVVGILNDLNLLYDQSDKFRNKVGCGVKIQEDRLLNSLIGPPKSTDLYLCYNMDMSTISPRSVGKMVLLDESFVALAIRASQRLGCSIDVLFLSAIGIALHKTGFGSDTVIPLALIVPLRDGESEVIGFLADQRNLSVPLTGNSCLFSVVHTVARMTRRREWEIPEPFSNCQRVLINIVQANFPKLTPLRQEVFLQQYEAPTGYIYRPMEIYLEQIDSYLWTLKLRCRIHDWDDSRVDVFLSHFRETVIDFLADPMSSVV